MSACVWTMNTSEPRTESPKRQWISPLANSAMLASPRSTPSSAAISSASGQMDPTREHLQSLLRHQFHVCPSASLSRSVEGAGRHARVDVRPRLEHRERTDVSARSDLGIAGHRLLYHGVRPRPRSRPDGCRARSRPVHPPPCRPGAACRGTASRRATAAPSCRWRCGPGSTMFTPALSQRRLVRRRIAASISARSSRSTTRFSWSSPRTPPPRPRNRSHRGPRPRRGAPRSARSPGRMRRSAGPSTLCRKQKIPDATSPSVRVCAASSRFTRPSAPRTTAGPSTTDPSAVSTVHTASAMRWCATRAASASSSSSGMSAGTTITSRLSSRSGRERRQPDQCRFGRPTVDVMLDELDEQVGSRWRSASC